MLLVWLCLLSPGELTLIPYLILTDKTNNSLTSLPSPKQFITARLFHNNSGPWKPVNNQEGLLWNLFTEVSVCISFIILQWESFIAPVQAFDVNLESLNMKMDFLIRDCVAFILLEYFTN